jgi:FkbM family methyltransferase
MQLITKVKNKIKQLISKPPAETRSATLELNYRYDAETVEIIKSLQPTANCIDVGAHKGDILKEILLSCPQGKHYAFEPLPYLFEELKKNFSKKAAVYPYALSDENGTTQFNYVITNPAYSGILKRKYDRPVEEDTLITVEQRKLDDVIPAEIPVHFIKIDVEGAEFGVLKGAKRILKQNQPLIIYEQGKGGSDIYGTEPGVFFDFMKGFGYNISLMEYYLRGALPFSKEEYCLQFEKGYNFYFIAYASTDSVN